MSGEKVLTEISLKQWLVETLSPQDDATGLVPEGAWPEVERLVEGIEAMAQERGLPVTPVVLLRAQDVLVHYLVARRLDEALASEGVTVSSQKDGKITTALHPCVEALGKARERLRKTMKELEDMFGLAHGPANQGLPDIMKPIVKRAEGVLEDALEFEQRKRGRAKTSGVGRQRGATDPAATRS